MSAQLEGLAEHVRLWRLEDGCEVDPDLILSRDGACIEDLQEIVFAWPSEAGTASEDEARTLIYVNRDVDIGSGDSIRTFVAESDVPPGAQGSGFFQGSSELWIDPTDKNYLYVGDETQAEQWPREPNAPECH